MSDPIKNTAAISLPQGFRFGEVPSVAPELDVLAAGRLPADPPLGPLAAFVHEFVGNGFNTIFRPDSVQTPTKLPVTPPPPPAGIPSRFPHPPWREASYGEQSASLSLATTRHVPISSPYVWSWPHGPSKYWRRAVGPKERPNPHKPIVRLKMKGRRPSRQSGRPPGDEQRCGRSMPLPAA